MNNNHTVEIVGVFKKEIHTVKIELRHQRYEVIDILAEIDADAEIIDFYLEDNSMIIEFLSETELILRENEIDEEYDENYDENNT